MINKSLEEMIKNAKIDSNSEIAESLRNRLSFLSPVSQSDFEFMLKKIKDTGNNNPQSLKKITNYAKIKNTKRECLKFEKLNMLRYKEATAYVRKKANDLDEFIVVANADCIKGKADFFYKLPDLNRAIKHVRKYNGD